MADLNLFENVNGVVCPIDPAEAEMCESCQ
jgi:hypothetical protein